MMVRGPEPFGVSDGCLLEVSNRGASKALGRGDC